jgi:predicted transcriptional regulator
MSREKQGFRDTIAALNEMFPDQGMLGKSEVARFLGVTPRTVTRYVSDGKITFKGGIERVTKADLARQVCI